MIYQGSCHCGHIAFEAEGDLHSVKECNCSICRRPGTGAHNGAEMFSVNVRCLENVDLPALKVKQVDGRSW